MTILLLTMSRITDLDSHGIYEDLIREFARNGHRICIVSPTERCFGKDTYLVDSPNANDWHKNVILLKVKTGNLQKVNLIEKGISTVTIEPLFRNAIKKYFKEEKFDLVLYSTPPITLIDTIRYVKKRDGAFAYLMLKDIFPQNAVDIGILSKSGLKGFIYRYFRKREKKLYEISDKIGCMSQANVDYVLRNNPEIPAEKVEICPNCIEYVDTSLTAEQKIEVRNQYGIPTDKKVFVYGGNLGKPQGIPFLIDCLRAEQTNSEAYFLIVGDGTEYEKLDEFVRTEKPTNVRLLRRLPHDEYDRMIAACDVGLIFLDHRFTIPNFPSRLLSYMQAGLPVLACTDCCSDIGGIGESFGWGCQCESNMVASFSGALKKMLRLDCLSMGNKGQQYLLNQYGVNRSVEIITKSIKLYGGNNV